MPKYYQTTCKVCNKEYKGRDQFFCGRSCQRTYLNKINNPSSTEKGKERLSLLHKGKIGTKNEKHWNWQDKKYLKRQRLDCKIELKHCYSKTKRCKKCYHKFFNGNNHPNWKNGITPQRTKEYKTPEYLNFVKTILKRDNYTCQYCYSYGRSIKLQVHHIKNYAEKELNANTIT